MMVVQVPQVDDGIKGIEYEIFVIQQAIEKALEVSHV